MPPHHALSSIGKLSISSALGGFLMFRPMVEELWNIEQFCNKNILISKLKKLGHTFGILESAQVWR
jgi:hypothetical protein